MAKFNESDVDQVTSITGCTPAQARDALTKTSDVQSAINYYLNQAHEGAQSKDDELNRAIAASLQANQSSKAVTNLSVVV